jgi:hypothetical protein
MTWSDAHELSRGGWTRSSTNEFGLLKPARTEGAVSKFYFAVRTDTHVLLADSVELQGMNEVRVEAAKRVGDLLKEHAAEFWTDEDWQMDVTNEAGLILFVINVSAHKTSATMGQ